MVTYAIHDIDSVAGFLELVQREKQKEEDRDHHDDFLFRGQPVDEPLLPRIARAKPRGKLLNIENLILREFERVSALLAEFKTDTEWDLLALAQHHGLPTRLLDWSYSALAALWFVVRKAPEKDESGNSRDGVVWILKSETEDFINFPTQESPFKITRTRIFRPRIIARRIAAQAGLFTVHKAMTGARFIPLERNTIFSRRLVKVRVGAASFPPLRKQLYACGVTYLSMVPDLDGVGEHLTWRYTRYEDELDQRSM
jgi:FRG domain-containing protein